MEDNGLPPVRRFITDHDEYGKAIFSNSVPEPLPWQELPDGARFSLGYATNSFPVNFTGEKDVSVYQYYTQNLPGITIPGGTVLRQSISTSVMALPGMDDSSTRRSALPSVWPKPRSNGSITTCAWRGAIGCTLTTRGRKNSVTEPCIAYTLPAHRTGSRNKSRTCLNGD
jgi:hypothetical protein